MNAIFLGMVLAASVAADLGPRMTLDEGSVACRSKAALEAMREAGGFERLPEFLVGTACFKLRAKLSGRIESLDDTGAVEIALRQRRSIAQPGNLWVERPGTDGSTGDELE